MSKRRGPKVLSVRTISVLGAPQAHMYGTVPAWEGTFEATVERIERKRDIFGVYESLVRTRKTETYTALTFDFELAKAWERNERIPERGPD